MKIWKITLVAGNEKSAIEYLKRLLHTFEIADKANLPMDAYLEDNVSTEEMIYCEHQKSKS